MSANATVINARLSGLENQRNNALNECVTLAAQIALYQERVKELQAELDALKAKKTKKRTKKTAKAAADANPEINQ